MSNLKGSKLYALFTKIIRYYITDFLPFIILLCNEGNEAHKQGIHPHFETQTSPEVQNSVSVSTRRTNVLQKMFNEQKKYVVGHLGQQ